MKMDPSISSATAARNIDIIKEEGSESVGRGERGGVEGGEGE